MALSRLNRKREDTEGDGNCAFNAFALAICNEYIMVQIENAVRAMGANVNDYLQDFIGAVSKVLRVENDWQSIKAELLKLRKTDKEKLQKILAAILRGISVDIALNKDPYRYLIHQERLYAPFLSAFENHRKSGQFDDVFSRHAFIIEKFDEVLASTSNTLQQDKAIDQWWWKEGYVRFYEQMRHDGVWAGDVDLQRLANYFQVTLTIIRDDEDMGTHGNFGYLPFLQEVVVQKNLSDIYYCLYSRGVIARHQHIENETVSHEFNIAEWRLVAQRLMKVPDYQRVLAFINAHSENLKKQRVPDDWSKKCIYELIQRNVIGRGADGKSQVFSLNYAEALLEIDEIPNLAEVMNACRKHHRERACIVLYNVSGKHWENTLETLTQDELAQRSMSCIFNKNPPSLTSWVLQRRGSDEHVVRRLT